MVLWDQQICWITFMHVDAFKFGVEQVALMNMSLICKEHEWSRMLIQGTCDQIVVGLVVGWGNAF